MTWGRWLLMALLCGALPALAGTGITYHGRLLDASGVAVVSSHVRFKVQVRTPGAENCLLYEEEQVKDLSQSKGVFAITLNDGSATVVNTEPFGLDRIFQNRGTFNFSAGKCVIGTSFTPNPTDGRKIAVEFDDGSFGGWEQIPAQSINYVPMAIESMTVGGYHADNMMRVVDGFGAPAVVSPFTLTQHGALLNLANGTGSIGGNAAGFTGSLSGDVTGAQAATVVTRIQGRAVDTAAPTNGQALVWSTANSRWEPGTVSGGGGGGGGVSTVTATSGPLTVNNTDPTNPILDIADASSSAKGVVQLTASSADTTAGHVVQANDTRLSDARTPTGTAGGELTGNYPNPTVVASATATNNSLVRRDAAGGIAGAAGSFTSLALTNGTSTLTLSTPVAFTTYATKLPASAGTNGQILTSNGTDMIWSTPSYMASVAPGTSGNILLSNGTSWTSAALPADANKVNKSGDTMTGSLTLSSGSLVAPANGLAIGTNQLVVSGGNVGVGTATPNASAKIEVVGAAVSRSNIIASGATVNLALGNQHLLKSPGGSAITLQNMVDGGVYTLVIADTTSRTYTFAGCNNHYFSPANAATSGRSTYSILVVVDGAVTDCYITWITGFN